MAIMTDIPTMPAPRSATPGTKGGAAAKGTEDGFRAVLNEESLKQALNAAEKPEKEQGNELLAGVGQTVAAAAIGAAEAPPAAMSETSAAAVETPAAPDADPACPEAAKAEIIPLASALGEKVKAELPAEKTAGTATPAWESGPALPAQETVSRTRPATIGEPIPETAVMPGPDGAPPEVVETAPSPVEHQAADIAEPASGKAAAPRANGLFQAPAATAASETAQQVIARLQQPAQNQAGGSQSETGRKGLMEASFAGILQTPAAKGQPLKGVPAPEPKADTVGVPPGGGQPDVAQAIRPAAGDEAGSDTSDALLEQATHRSESLKAGESRNSGDQGRAPVFDSALASASANAGKAAIEGQQGPVQSASPENASLAASSPNQEVLILDQVLDQMPLNRIGDKNRIVIRLHPEELGEVKLDLVMEKDQLKAHLVTQTQQVQEILEKHLPRLQEALHNQGVKLDNIQVSVDSRGNQGQEFFNRNHRSSTPFTRSFGHHRAAPEPAPAAASAGPVRASGGGLSLRI
jgi:flagellar hook-length control protein FliK